MTDPPTAPDADVMEERELTELFGACEAKRPATEDNDGEFVCVGVEGAELVLEL